MRVLWPSLVLVFALHLCFTAGTLMKNQQRPEVTSDLYLPALRACREQRAHGGPHCSQRAIQKAEFYDRLEAYWDAPVTPKQLKTIGSVCFAFFRTPDSFTSTMLIMGDVLALCLDDEWSFAQPLDPSTFWNLLLDEGITISMPAPAGDETALDVMTGLELNNDSHIFVEGALSISISLTDYIKVMAAFGKRTISLELGQHSFTASGRSTKYFFNEEWGVNAELGRFDGQGAFVRIVPSYTASASELLKQYVVSRLPSPSSFGTSGHNAEDTAGPDDDDSSDDDGWSYGFDTRDDGFDTRDYDFMVHAEQCVTGNFGRVHHEFLGAPRIPSELVDSWTY